MLCHFKQWDDPSLYRAIAPLPNQSAAIAIYNFHDERTLSTTITPEDYTHAAAMLQPYQGPWSIPPDGLIAHSWRSGKVERLEGGKDVTISGFHDRLLQLSPIRHGWSVIGRTNKYLSAAGVDVVEYNDSSIKVNMSEPGTLTVWSSQGKPSATGVDFEQVKEKLYSAQIPRPPPGIS